MTFTLMGRGFPSALFSLPKHVAWCLEKSGVEAPRLGYSNADIWAVAACLSSWRAARDRA